MISFAKYYRKLVREVTVNLSELIENYKEETVHNMRIAYKRIRAMNKFLAVAFKGDKEIGEQISILESIYKNAGIIREIQLSKKLLDSSRNKLDKPFGEFYDFLDNRQIETKSVLAEQLNSFDIDGIKRYENKVYLLLKKADERKLFTRAIKFIKERIKITESLVLKITDKSRYHKIRTNAKEEYFFLLLLFSKNDCRKKNFNLKHLRNLGIKLGKWHDVKIFLEYVYSFLGAKNASVHQGPDSEYGLLIHHAENLQRKALKKIDDEIIHANRELTDYLEQLELIGLP
jgi:CHAD domain-containing protein